MEILLRNKIRRLLISLKKDATITPEDWYNNNINYVNDDGYEILSKDKDVIRLERKMKLDKLNKI